MKDVHEKESIIGARGGQKNPSLGIKVWHHSASFVMPDSDPRDGFFYLPHTPMIDPYNLPIKATFLIPTTATFVPSLGWLL